MLIEVRVRTVGVLGIVGFREKGVMQNVKLLRGIPLVFSVVTSLLTFRTGEAIKG